CRCHEEHGEREGVVPKGSSRLGYGVRCLDRIHEDGYYCDASLFELGTQRSQLVELHVAGWAPACEKVDERRSSGETFGREGLAVERLRLKRGHGLSPQ